MKRLRRRRFLTSLAGALTIGVVLPACRRAPTVDRFAADPAVEGEINAWVVVGRDDKVVVRVAKADMGQGVLTALAMAVTEEIECRWDDVRVEFADVNRSSRNGRLYGRFLTDGSSSIRGALLPMQRAGVNARLKLVEAAAARWQVAPSECFARDGRVQHAPSQRTIRFGELVAEAAKVRIDADRLVPKEPSNWRLLGRRTPLLGSAAMVTGTTVYGIDVLPPGTVHAAVTHSPVLGGTLRSLVAARPARDDEDVFAIGDAVVAVGGSYWRARALLSQSVVEWAPPAAGAASSAAMRASCLAAVQQPGTLAINRGEALAVIDRTPELVEASYETPYLAHACMEPLNCTARVSDSRVDVWVGTQDAEAVVRVAAAACNVDPAQVHVHMCPLGGGFGRRIATDFVAEALRIAQRVRKPVKLVWSREQDIRAGHFRPMSVCRLAATLEPGNGATLSIRVAAPSITAQHRPQELKEGIDPALVSGLSDTPYAFANLRVEAHIVASTVPVWYWRSVGDSQNAFAIECFLDELALRTQVEPLELRRRLLDGKRRHLGVLAAMQQHLQRLQELPKGAGRGVAMHEYGKSVVGLLVEVEVVAGVQVKVRSVDAFIDCGQVVNPLTVEAQVEGAVVFGLSAALFEEIQVAEGEVVQSNFDTYRVLRMAECPPITTHLVQGEGVIGGVGEVGVPPVAPALCNAIYRATGVRVRSLPVAAALGGRTAPRT